MKFLVRHINYDAESSSRKKILKKGRSMALTTENNESSSSNDKSSTILTDEEKTWLDDLWNLDEAPEAIRASKAFMTEAVKERGDSLEYASDDLKNDKEIVLAAIGESFSSLKYASEDIKSDSLFALETIKVANEALRNNNYYYISDAIQFFPPKVFDDEEIIKHLLEVDPQGFITSLLYRNEEDESILKILKKYNSAIKHSVENQFEGKFNKVKEMIEESADAWDMISEFRLFMPPFLAYYNENFELERCRWDDKPTDYPYPKLAKRTRDEIISKLENNAESSKDFMRLIFLTYRNNKWRDMTLFNEFCWDKENDKLLENYYEQLLDYSDDAGLEDLLLVTIHDEDWRLSRTLPFIAERIGSVIGQKMLEADLDLVMLLLENDLDRFDIVPDEYRVDFISKAEAELSEEEMEEYKYIIDELRDMDWSVTQYHPAFPELECYV